MNNMQPGTTAVSAPPRRWPLFLLGIALFVLGPAIYVLQFFLHSLRVPWHVPVLASLGVVLMVVSVRRRPGVVRMIFLALFVLVCAFEWFFVLIATRSPEYAG